MDRRESIKSLVLGSLVGGLALESCVSDSKEELTAKVWEHQYGRTPEEKTVDQKLLGEQFFTPHEIETITQLGHLILPPNENGSILDAGVPEFIEFMAKDFTSITNVEQKTILDEVAFPNPELSSSEQPQPIQFFSLIKNLVMTGYFTSAIGIEELGYVGNSPNVWDGVPQDVLDDHGLAYDPEWIAKCIDQEKRNDVAQWDNEGNLIS